MNNLKQIDGSYNYRDEMEYLIDFGILGFNDWTDCNDEGLTWAIEDKESKKAILIFLHLLSYDIVVLNNTDQYSYNNMEELFITNDMGELWSIIRSNLHYFDSILTKERG